jgi:hypothetical protein
MIGLLLLGNTMRIYLNGTANLGDFLNGLPVMSGISKEYGKYSLTIKKEMRKFKGLTEFLMYQDLFTDVMFDDEVFMYGDVMQMSSWPIREDKNNKDRPTETCRYENFMKDNFGLMFDVDDEFIIKTPEYNVEVKDTYYVGDRWAVGEIDTRRKTHILSHLTDCEFIDYNNDMLMNAYIIRNLKKPFITNLTGVGMMADLLNKELWCVWKAEDWNPEFRVGEDVSWDNGKNSKQVFEKHFYMNRKGRLVHANELEGLMK